MMPKDQSLMWDNDPFALPKTEATKLAVMEQLYRRLHSRGVLPDSDEAAKFSKGEPKTYKAWLGEKDASK